MTKQEAIEQMKKGEKVTHTYFSDNEYIYQKGCIIYSEDGVRHEEFWTLRNGLLFEDGWSIFKSN